LSYHAADGFEHDMGMLVRIKTDNMAICGRVLIYLCFFTWLWHNM